MKKTFVSNLAFLLFLNLLIKPIWIFGIDVEVQNIVRAEEYGLYASLLSFTIIFNILLDFGINNFNNREIARNNDLLKKYFSNLILLKLILAIVYAIFCFTIAYFLNWSGRELNLLIFLVLNQFLLSLILYFRSNVSALHLFKTDSLISVTDKLLMIAICSVLLFIPKYKSNFHIEWFIYSQTAGYLITAIIAFFIVLRKASFFKLAFDFRFLKRILRQTLPYATLTLFMALYIRTDMVMLKELLPTGKVEAGIYAQSFRILDAVAIFALLFANILLPMFSKMLKNKEDVSQLVLLSYSLLIVPVFIFSISAYFFSLDIMSLLYIDHQESSAQIFSILILGFIPIASTYIFGTLLTANKSLKALNIITGCGVVLNIALNLFLIYNYKAQGAAIASLITQTLTSVAQIYVCKVSLKIKMPFKYIFKVLSFVAFIFASNLIANKLDFFWIYKFLVVCFVCMLFAFVINLINTKGLLSIFIKRG